MPLRIESQAEPIPGYKLIDRLGGGGFGEVWRCEAPGGLLKAIKFVYGDLTAQDEEGLRRPEQELKALKRVKTVRHPYLLSLERYDVIDGRLAIVMELADRNLWDRFKECRTQGLTGIPRGELLRYLEEAAEVLDLMNGEHQLQHLDIKPQNLFLVHNHVKVADFGLVKDLEGMQATVTGGVTPVYAAPETFDGIVSRFCDQYSLAIVYQELLTGQRPFAGISMQQLIMQHLNGIPNLAALPAEDRPAIARALAKKPEDRHPTCTALVQMLRGGAAATADPSAMTPAAESVRPSASEPVRPPLTPGPVPSRPLSAPPPQPASPTPARAPSAYGPPRPPAITPRPPARMPEPPATAGLPPVLAPVQTVARIVTGEEEDDSPQADGPAVFQEEHGDGILMPALLIGLGQLGREVLDRFRAAVVERFGAVTALPHLRWLYFDTDPEAVQAALQGLAAIPWTSSETVLARLQRASGYMKPREGRVRIESFCDPRLLYRMPRNPATTGMRALGRVALFDNYRLLASRLRAELEACLAADALASGDRNTGLGVRSNRPRVYIVTGLGGGTGSGTFVDVAYLARSLLRRLGCDIQEVIGLFLVPAADRDPAQTMALGNTHAALLELHHFSSPDVAYEQKFDEREKTVTDPEPPFQRAMVLPLPPARRADDGQTIALSADWLNRELLTPLGKTAEARRDAPPTGQVVQTFGQYCYSWPRRSLLQQVARVAAQRLVEHWTGRDCGLVQADVQALVHAEITRHGLGPEALIEHLQKACERSLGKSPEDLFASILAPMAPRGRRGPELTPATVAQAMDRLEQLLGRPDEMPATRKANPIADALDAEAQTRAQDSGTRLAEVALQLVEQPAFRLAGAEEAVRQIGAFLSRTLEHHDPLGKELTDRAAASYQRIFELLTQLQASPGRRAGALAAEIYEVLRYYPKFRYQSLLLRRVIGVYQTWRGHLTEQAQQIGFCRHRLKELFHGLQTGMQVGGALSGGPGEVLLPAQWASVQDAIAGLLDQLTEIDVQSLDNGLQDMIRQQFNGLLAVCMAKSNLMRDLQAAILQRAEQFMSSRVPGGDVVAMFLARHGAEAPAAVSRAFQAAAPELAARLASDSAEIAIVAVAQGGQAQQLQELIRRGLAQAELILADGADDILFYREQTQVPLASLEQMGPLGQAAYEQMLHADNCTPHCRTDITEWHEL